MNCTSQVRELCSDSIKDLLDKYTHIQFYWYRNDIVWRDSRYDKFCCEHNNIKFKKYSSAAEYLEEHFKYCENNHKELILSHKFEKLKEISLLHHKLLKEFGDLSEELYGFIYNSKDIDPIIDTLEYGTDSISFEDYVRLMSEYTIN